MKTIQNRTLGLLVPVEVPASADEFNRLPGVVGADQCVDDANSNVIYRQWNHEFRAALCEALEEETGVPRKTRTEGEGDKAKEVYAEKEKEYVDRLRDDEDISEEDLNALACRVAKEIKFDPSPRKRAAKPSKELLNMAAGILAAIESGETDEETVASKFETALGIESFTQYFGEISEETLVKAIQADIAKEKAERQSKFI